MRRLRLADRQDRQEAERLFQAYPMTRSLIIFFHSYVMNKGTKEATVALEDSLKSWAKAPGQTEQEQCDRAVTAVRKAKDASESLSKHTIRVFAQGSYYNRTNVREDGDVDVCLLCADSVFPDYPEGMGAKDFGLSSPADYGYPNFKNDVQTALNDHFGKEHVTRGNKAFDIKENTYRIAADVVPCFEHRRYDKDGTSIKPEGTAFLPDTGARIINWPDQHYANGIAKKYGNGTALQGCG